MNMGVSTHLQCAPIPRQRHSIPAKDVEIVAPPFIQTQSDSKGIVLYIRDKRPLGLLHLPKQPDRKLYLQLAFPLTETTDNPMFKPATEVFPVKVREVVNYESALEEAYPSIFFTDNFSYAGSPSKTASDLVSNAPFLNLLTDASGAKISGDIRYQQSFFNPKSFPDYSILQFEGKSDVALNAFNKSDDYFNSISFDGEYLFGSEIDTSRYYLGADGKPAVDEGIYALMLYGADFDIQADKQFAHVDAVEGLTLQGYFNSAMIRDFQQKLFYCSPGFGPAEPAIFAKFTAVHVDALSGALNRGVWEVTGELDWTKPLVYWVRPGSMLGSSDDKNPVKFGGFAPGFKSVEVDFITKGQIAYDFQPDKVHDKFGVGLQAKFVDLIHSSKTIPFLGAFLNGDPTISVLYENGSVAPTYQHYGGFLGALGLTF